MQVDELEQVAFDETTSVQNTPPLPHRKIQSPPQISFSKNHISISIEYVYNGSK